MSNVTRESASLTGGTESGSNSSPDHREAGKSVSSLARNAAHRAKEAASDTASSLLNQAQPILNKQVMGRAAGGIALIARSIEAGARELQLNAPMLGGWASNLAGRMRTYEGEVRDMPVEDALRKASDVVRRNPALVFGITALAGFLVARVIKSAPDRAGDDQTNSIPEAPDFASSPSTYSSQSFNKPAQF